MSDIKFSCLHCGQHLIIDARCAGRWVKCAECGTEGQVPSTSPLRAPRPLRLQLSPKVIPFFILAPLWSVVLWLGCAKPLMESGLPPLPPWKQLQRAEALLIETNYTGAAESLTVLLIDFPQSKEAQTVRRLLRLVRAKGASPPAEASDGCTGQDARLIKHQMDIKAALLAFYSRLPDERRAVFDSLFGPGTFLTPDLSLAGVLFTLQQVEATQAKARKDAIF